MNDNPRTGHPSTLEDVFNILPTEWSNPAGRPQPRPDDCAGGPAVVAYQNRRQSSRYFTPEANYGTPERTEPLPRISAWSTACKKNWTC